MVSHSRLSNGHDLQERQSKASDPFVFLSRNTFVVSAQPAHIPKAMPSEWGGRAISKLNSLSELGDGWCTDGTKPSADAISEAKNILDELILQNVKPRRIAPMADGGVVFVFRSELIAADIVIYNGAKPFLKIKESIESPLQMIDAIAPSGLVAALTELLSQ